MSDRYLYAAPRPAMRGRYLIRNPRWATVIAVMDGLLAVLHPRRPSPPVPDQPRRILVSDWTHLGNIVIDLPVLRLLHKVFPNAEVGFLGGSWARTVLEGTGLYDHLHCIDHFRMTRAHGSRLSKIRRYVDMRRRALAELRAICYDVAIDLSSNFPPVSPLLFYAARIPVRAGFTSGGFGPLLTHPVRFVHASRPMSDYPRDLLLALWPRLDLAREALAPCYPGYPRVTPQMTLAIGRYIVLHTGSGAWHREWPEEHWARVAAALTAIGIAVVLAGSGVRETERIRRIAAGLSADRVAVFVDQPWADYVDLIIRASHLVCLESSAAHIAAAFSVPTTVIFPGINDFVQWGPNNPNAQVLTNRVGCAPCYRGNGCEAMACIRGVTPDQVVSAVLSAIAAPQRARLV